MAENELFALVIIAASIGGAVGAKTANHAPWKGAVIAIGALLLPVLVVILTGLSNQIAIHAMQLVAAGVLSGAFGLGGRSASQVVIGAVLAVAALYGLLSLF